VTKIARIANFPIILIHFDSKLLYNRKKTQEVISMANKDYKLQTHVDAGTKAKLDELCAKTGESLSSLLRRALIKLLESEQ
jgi:hypothetical protein